MFFLICLFIQKLEKQLNDIAYGTQTYQSSLPTAVSIYKVSYRFSIILIFSKTHNSENSSCKCHYVLFISVIKSAFHAYFFIMKLKTANQSSIDKKNFVFH